MRACDACVRRSGLLAELAGNIRVAARRRVPMPELLALDDATLARALGLGRVPRIDATRIREAGVAAGLASVCRHDGSFPDHLRAARDCCAALFIAGDPDRLRRLTTEPAVAIVGSRQASPYGLEVAHALGRDLGACGVPVVSGMAFGVDAAAHEGALDGRGLTVAVLARGPDAAYPKRHARLYDRIVRTGLVVSEFPPGFEPEKWCFPARNRIMAALAEMTIVVEGRCDSGSLITSGFAQDLGRDVGAVPGLVTSELAAGANDLLADGACVVRGAGDVLDVLFGPGAAQRWEIGRLAPPPDLDARLLALLEAVERGARTPEQIAAGPDDLPTVMSGLGELELMGLVRSDGAGRYVRGG